VLVLGIDTSAQPGSVALFREEVRAEQGAPVLLEASELGAGQPSETLLPAISALLGRCRVEKRSLSLVAVASGPGSFTGLRVSLATAKGLAEACSIPLVAVSVLEAIALGSGGEKDAAERRVLTALDAHRGEVFFGEFLLPAGGGEARTLREAVASWEAFLAQCKATPSEPASPWTPEESLAARLRAEGIAATVVPRPTAAEIARIGRQKFLAGERTDAAALDANYLRRSEAELVLAPRLGAPLRRS
jgi:tRNA threonylcarbamoyladenosine biosynthesis protein TsaB